MRKLRTILFGGAIMAWVAYLSWPAPADFPAARGKEVSKARQTIAVDEAESYEVYAPKASAQPSA